MPISTGKAIVLLEASMKAHRPLLLTGAPGIGKTDIIFEAARRAGFKVIVSHPAVADPTDAKGLPWPDAKKGRADFLPFGELADAINATEPTVWFLDDLGQATPAVQAAYMQLLLARRINGHKLSDHVTFVAATNRRTDGANVTGILEPVKSRFTTIIEIEPNIHDWSNWAFKQPNFSSTLIAFLNYRHELLSAFKKSADLTNSPTPRTWSNLNAVEAMNLPAEIEAEAMAGAVGEGAAVEYIGFRHMAQGLGNIDAILLDPDHAAIPTQLDQLYATCIGLAGKATPSNFASIARYAERLNGAQHGEFAVLMIRDAQRKNPGVLHTNAFVQLNSGDLGQLLTGRE